MDFGGGSGYGGGGAAIGAALVVGVLVLWNTGCLVYNISDIEKDAVNYSLLVYYGDNDRVIYIQTRKSDEIADLYLSRPDIRVFNASLTVSISSKYLVSEREKEAYWKWLCSKAKEGNQGALKALIYYSSGGANFTRIDKILALSWTIEEGYDSNSLRQRMSKDEIQRAEALVGKVSERDFVEAYAPPPPEQILVPFLEANPKKETRITESAKTAAPSEVTPKPISAINSETDAAPTPDLEDKSDSLTKKEPDQTSITPAVEAEVDRLYKAYGEKHQKNCIEEVWAFKSYSAVFIGTGLRRYRYSCSLEWKCPRQAVIEYHDLN